MESKWNLSDVLPEEKFDELLSQLEKERQTLEGWVAKVKANMKKTEFKKMLEYGEEVGVKISRLSYLPSLLEAVNQKDTKAKLMNSKVKNLLVAWSETEVKLSLWLKGKRKPVLDDINATRLFGVIKDLEYGLKRGREAAKYSLLENEENIITNKDVNGMDTLGEIREMLETEMKYELKIGQRKRNLKTQSELLALVYHPKSEVRETAYRALLKKQKDQLPKFFAIYQAVVKDWAYEAKLRGYKSAIAVRNFGNDVPDEAVEELLEVCQKNRDIFQKYFKWKAGKLRIKQLKRSDIYAPIQGKAKKYSMEESRDLVLGSLAKFSDKFYRLGKEIIDRKHIDWLPGQNKRGGAFCATVAPKIAPYILLNFTGKERDVSTLAHELGHGIHSMYASAHYPSSQQANLPLAETASTLAEMILFEEILSQEKEQKIKAAILSDKIADAYATILRQNYFVLFEKKAHEKIPLGITAEGLSSLYYQNLKEQFGSSVKLDPRFRYEWSYIAHFFESPFYCYAYNFGELLALGLYARYKENRQLWRGRIETILSAGGSENPEKVLKRAKIDIGKSGFWQESFDIIRTWQQELIKVEKI